MIWLLSLAAGMEVIGAGLGRSGTASLQLALNELGFKTYHMMEVRAEFRSSITQSRGERLQRASVKWMETTGVRAGPTREMVELQDGDACAAQVMTSFGHASAWARLLDDPALQLGQRKRPALTRRQRR